MHKYKEILSLEHCMICSYSELKAELVLLLVEWLRQYALDIRDSEFYV